MQVSAAIGSSDADLLAHDNLHSQLITVDRKYSVLAWAILKKAKLNNNAGKRCLQNELLFLSSHTLLFVF